MNAKVRCYENNDEMSWLDVHASVMVDSYAWWTVIHKKPVYKNEIIDLVATVKDNIIGFITIEINSEIIPNQKDYGFVWEFGVHRNYRGHNIGLLLIKKAHSILNSKYNINKSLWYSQDENSQKYYKKLGMKEIERHWQFSIYPNKECSEKFSKQGFICWYMRGSCAIDNFKTVKEKFDVITDDDAVTPKICIGYEFIL